jgi:hypothetical protein
MNDHDVMKLLRAVHELDVKEHEERRAQERAHCLPLPRFRTALLRGDWTADERLQVLSCSYCQMTLSKVKAHLWHPTFGQLWHYLGEDLGVAQRDLSDEERMHVGYHLTVDQCRRCLFIVQVLRPLAQASARAGVVESFLGSLPPMSATPVPVAFGTAGFAGEGNETATVEAEEKPLKVRLAREEAGWVVRAEAMELPVEYAMARFSLVRPEGREWSRRYAFFSPAFDAWWTAATRVAPPDMAALGELHLVAVVLPVESLAEEDLHYLEPSLAECLAVDAQAKEAWQHGVERLLQIGDPSMRATLERLRTQLT